MPIPSKAKSVNRSIMREEVYNAILTWIMEGELRPGEKLLDKELSDHMGVSRTPVREALRRLEDKGLVETAVNRWTRVTQIPVSESEMIYPIIWNLEKMAISMAIDTLSEPDFKAMDRANTALTNALKKKDPVGASRADYDFHDAFVTASGNIHLINILQDLKIKHRRVEVTYFEGHACATYSVDEHLKILDALRQRDIELARSLIQSNWQSSLDRLKDIGKKINGESNHLTS